jgi:hypothetical protein
MPTTPITLLGWSLDIDPEATRQAYQHLAVKCDCAYCRNFLAALAQLPGQIHRTLQIFGVDPAKPAEIVEYTQNPDGTHFYGWWYHAVGRISAERDAAGSAASAQLTADVTVDISTKADLAAPDFPQPILQIELFSNLPWVLGEQLDTTA